MMMVAMARIFITGSSDGLGLAAARHLLDEGHSVVVHARNPERASQLTSLVPDAEVVLVADLASRAETLRMGEEADRLGRFDAVIHNAGVGNRESQRRVTPEGHAHVLAINVVAPYMLTATMTRPARLVYLSSGMHLSGDSSLRDVDWTKRSWNGTQAYCDSKLFAATLACAIARRWPGVLSNAVNPGWVPTKMGGAHAPDDLELGHLTQTWLAVSDDSAALVTGCYFFHQRPEPPLDAALDPEFQDALIALLEELTGVAFPAP
jgi:NAD(P)-dependent dehydrogenase (short-subunit alcohol dehydrogenase family)